jgi:DNA-binding transcriptional MerR regulator
VEYRKDFVAEKTGLPKRTITHWADLGIVEAINKIHVKGGLARIFDDRGIRQFCIARELQRAGIELKIIKKEISRIMNAIEDGANEIYIMETDITKTTVDLRKLREGTCGAQK